MRPHGLIISLFFKKILLDFFVIFRISIGHPLLKKMSVPTLCMRSFIYEDPIAMYYTLPSARFPHDPLISN